MIDHYYRGLTKEEPKSTIFVISSREKFQVSPN